MDNSFLQLSLILLLGVRDPQKQHFRVHLGMSHKRGSCTSLYRIKMGSTPCHDFQPVSCIEAHVCLGPASYGLMHPGNIQCASMSRVNSYSQQNDLWCLYLTLLHLHISISFLGWVFWVQNVLIKLVNGSLNSSVFKKVVGKMWHQSSKRGVVTSIPHPRVSFTISSQS